MTSRRLTNLEKLCWLMMLVGLLLMVASVWGGTPLFVAGFALLAIGAVIVSPYIF